MKNRKMVGILVISMLLVSALFGCNRESYVPATNLREVRVYGMAVHDAFDVSLIPNATPTDRWDGVFPTKAVYMKDDALQTSVTDMEYPEVTNYGYDDVAVQILGTEVVFMEADLDVMNADRMISDIVTANGRTVHTLEDVKEALGTNYRKKTYDYEQLLYEIVYYDWSNNGVMAEFIYHVTDSASGDAGCIVDYVKLSSLK